MEMESDLAMVSASLLGWLNRHPHTEGLFYRRLAGQIVRIVPDSEFTPQNKDGTLKAFVRVIPVEKRGLRTPIPIARQFLEEVPDKMSVRRNGKKLAAE